MAPLELLWTPCISPSCCFLLLLLLLGLLSPEHCVAGYINRSCRGWEREKDKETHTGRGRRQRICHRIYMSAMIVFPPRQGQGRSSVSVTLLLCVCMGVVHLHNLDVCVNDCLYKSLISGFHQTLSG